MDTAFFVFGRKDEASKHKKNDDHKATTATSTSSTATCEPQSPRSPQSVTDSWANSPHCFDCGAEFNLFNRRHHCRSCGESVCSAHSSLLCLRVADNKSQQSSCTRTCHACKAIYRSALRNNGAPSSPTSAANPVQKHVAANNINLSRRLIRRESPLVGDKRSATVTETTALERSLHIPLHNRDSSTSESDESNTESQSEAYSSSDDEEDCPREGGSVAFLMGVMNDDYHQRPSTATDLVYGDQAPINRPASPLRPWGSPADRRRASRRQGVA